MQMRQIQQSFVTSSRAATPISLLHNYIVFFFLFLGIFDFSLIIFHYGLQLKVFPTICGILDIHNQKYTC